MLPLLSALLPVCLQSSKRPGQLWPHGADALLCALHSIVYTFVVSSP